MAIAGLGWSWSQLSDAADVSRGTLARFFQGEELKSSTVDAIRAALEAAGVGFISEGEPSAEGGAGVRLPAERKPSRR